MPLALVLGLVGLVLVAAAATVLYEDQRESRRRSRRRHARLAALGETDSRGPAGP
ncbi:hypothetical protein [Saccharomonospora iraqiensis]|uniref:hypothetical protein n=1 Tax=Saccharomonospora iraqiensis TaxID=52698 RepID=UPI0018EFBD90|nr:hypothetical protein [Saccharomonospora iraqiensis]